MDIHKYEIRIKKHVFDQALKRKINPELIEKALVSGVIKREGKNKVKFITETVVCVGEIIGNIIKIITIERRWRNK